MVPSSITETRLRYRESMNLVDEKTMVLLWILMAVALVSFAASAVVFVLARFLTLD